ARGTEIVLHLKKDAAKYLETYEIERIVRSYSDNIQFPIFLVPEEGEPRQINSASALWQRSKSELSAEDYKQAYQSIAGAFDEPAMTLHYRAEGRQSYAVLLFAPCSMKAFGKISSAVKSCWRCRASPPRRARTARSSNMSRTSSRTRPTSTTSSATASSG